MTTKTLEEEKLLSSARLLDERELNMLIEVVNAMAKKKEAEKPTKEDKERFVKFLEQLREKTSAKGLTPEILEEILAENG